MSRKRKRLVWVLRALGAFLCLLLALLVLAPRLINLEPIKEKVLASFSQKLGGQVEYQRIGISILPRPCLVLHEGNLSIPGKITGTMESLTIYPKVLPLLKGQVRISKLLADAPDFKIDLPRQPKNHEKGGDDISLALIEKKVTPILAVMVLKAAGLRVQVERGRLSFLEGNNPWLWFQDIEGRIGLPPDTLNLAITCKSNLSEEISFNGGLDSEDLRGKGRLVLSRLRPQVVTDLLFPKASMHVADAEMDLSAVFKIDGPKTFQTDLDGNVSRLTLRKGNEKLVLKGATLNGGVYLDGDKTRVSLSQLDMDYPRLGMTGELLMGPGQRRVSVRLEGKGVDVHSFREAALAVAGDMPVTQEIFSIVKGGQVPLITLHMAGESPADLGEIKNTLIEGRIIDGKIFVPDAELDLEDVKGEVVISKGFLEGKGLEATLGKTRGSQGILKLGLVGDPAPFHLDMMVKADVAEIPAVLERLVHNKSVVREIDLIRKLEGNVTARLILGESLGSIKTRVNVSQLHLLAKYERLPYPLVVTAGQLSFDGTRLSVSDLSGKLGNSGFSQLSGGFDWDQAPYLEVKSGDLNISLDEVYAWFSSFKQLRERLKEPKGVKGRLALTAISLKGPFLVPRRWSFQVTGEAKGLLVDAILGGPGEVPQASFDATEKTLSLKDAQINLPDAFLNVSGRLDDYLDELSRVDIQFDGDLGAGALRRFAGLAGMPTLPELRSPLSISKAHLVWERGGMAGFSGNLDVKEGPRLSMDIVYEDGNLGIKRLGIEDKDSSAVMGFDLTQKEIGLRFSGHLKRTTLEKFLPETRFPTGSITGDFQARFERDHPMNGTATGNLEGAEISFPSKIVGPLRVERFSLSAKEKEFVLQPAIIEWGDTRLVFEGKLGLDGEKIRLDMDVSADGLDVEELAAFVRKEEKQGVPGEGKGPREWPLRGELRVKSDHLQYRKFVWRPLHVNLSFDPDGIAASIVKANLCGISMPGTLKLSDKGLQLDFRPVCENQKLNPTIICLTDRTMNMDGTFDFRGGVTGKGTGHDLTRSLQGSFECVAKDGQIYRADLLAEILAILNVTDIFEEILKGKLPDLAKEGFPYKSITVKARLENGKLILTEMVMDGATIDLAGHGEIDLVDEKVDVIILASFLSTVDSIVKLIPLVGHILNGTLISIPIKVTGDWRHPDVHYVPASAVGSGLLGIVERTLKLPIKVIEPILQKDKKKPPEPQQKN